MKEAFLTLAAITVTSPALADTTTLVCTFNHRTEYVWTYLLDLKNNMLLSIKQNDSIKASNLSLTIFENEIRWTEMINQGKNLVYYSLDRTTLRLKLVNTWDNDYTYFYDCQKSTKQL